MPFQVACSSTTWAAPGPAPDDLGSVVGLLQKARGRVEQEFLHGAVRRDARGKFGDDPAPARFLPADVLPQQERREAEVIPQGIARKIGLVQAVPPEEAPAAGEEGADVFPAGDLAARGFSRKTSPPLRIPVVPLGFTGAMRVRGLRASHSTATRRKGFCRLRTKASPAVETVARTVRATRQKVSPP